MQAKEYLDLEERLLEQRIEDITTEDLWLKRLVVLPPTPPPTHTHTRTHTPPMLVLFSGYIEILSSAPLDSRHYPTLGRARTYPPALSLGRSVQDFLGKYQWCQEKWERGMKNMVFTRLESRFAFLCVMIASECNCWSLPQYLLMHFSRTITRRRAVN